MVERGCIKEVLKIFDIIDALLKTKLKMEWEKMILISLYVVTIILTIPILIASFYNFPCADDFDQAANVYKIVSSQDNVLYILGKIVSNAYLAMKDQYFNWSGCYSSYFFSALEPFAFHKSLIFLNTFIFVGITIISVWYFLSSVLNKVLKLGKVYSNIIILIMINLMIQFIPSAFDAFYWFNGSFYNTIGFCAALVFSAIIVRLLCGITGYKKTTYFIVLSALAIFIGGTNYSTILVLLIMLLIVNVYLLFTIEVEKINKVLIISSTMVLIVCFIISVAAPGNSIRADYFNQQSAIKAILNSFLMAFWQMRGVLNIPILISLVFCAFLIIRKIKARKYHCKYPIIVLLFTFGLYSATFTPIIYATSGPPEARLVNIQYWFLLLFLLFDFVYLWGWIYCRYYEIVEPLEKNSHILKILRNKRYAILLTCVIIFLCLTLGHVKEISGVKVVCDLKNNTLQQFQTEMQIREELYNNPDIINIKVKELSKIPIIFTGYADVSEDIDYSINKAIANFYNKKSVQLIKGE